MCHRFVLKPKFVAGGYLKVETLIPIGKLDPGVRAAEMELDLSRIPEESLLAEKIHYDTLLMEETKFDPFQCLALAATNTKNIKIGTSVAIAFARSPFLLAQSAWSLQAISNGRLVLGIGSQVRGHIQRRYGLSWHPPGQWMRDYVGALRALWTGWQNKTDINFSSQHYNLNLNVPLFTPSPIKFPEIPIHVAAVNPYMCKVASEVADGVRLHPVCSARFIEESLIPSMIKERKKGFEVCLKPLIAVGDRNEDLDIRRELVRERLAFYCSTPSYSAPFESLGLGDLCREMANLSKKSQWNKMKSKIDDQLLNEFAIIETYDNLSATIKTRYANLIDRIELTIPLPKKDGVHKLQEIINSVSTL